MTTTYTYDKVTAYVLRVTDPRADVAAVFEAFTDLCDRRIGCAEFDRIKGIRRANDRVTAAMLSVLTREEANQALTYI